jgi:platelet-activating factor acetylhydrolase
VEDDGRPAPHFYYAIASAHLSQSDFGILFPWVTRKLFAIEEPERILKLNLRAILQLLRESRIPVSPTSALDMEMNLAMELMTEEDAKIFGTEGEIRGWHFVTTDVTNMQDVTIEEDSGVDAKAQPSDAVVAGELMRGMQGTGERLQPRGAESVA